MITHVVISRILRLLFVAYVLATLVHIGLVMHHEPFAFDAWNIAGDTHAEPFSVGRFFRYVAFEYTHSNPRVGQWFTYLGYKLEWFSVIATPLVYGALALGVFVLGTGRFPRWGRDLALLALAIGCLWFAVPRIGMIMFCRAYGANYLYGATIQLWFLVPLRLRRDGVATLPACIAYGVLGFIAGACNEHTGPTLVLFMVGYVAVVFHRSGAMPPLRLAGAIGAIVGFAAIFFAPGQGERYEGLATKVTLVGRLLQRGITNNLDIFRDWVIACAPILGLLAILLVIARDDDPEPRRGRLVLLQWALIAGSLIAATVFVSPKLGPRFYLHGSVLVLAAFVGICDVVLTTHKRLAPFVALAVAASVYAGARTIPLYLRVHDQSDERVAALEASQPGTVFTAESYEQVEDSWWFLGDDFRDIKKRDLIADYFDLKGVIFRAVDLEAPLGVSDVRLVPRYTLDPPTCLDEHGGLELGVFKGLDVGSIHKAMKAAIAGLRERIGASGRLDRLDLAVQFTGAPPKLPRANIVVGKWQAPDRFEGYVAQIVRGGTGKTREVVVPKELAGFELWIYQVGTEARQLPPDRTFVPWKRGGYWVLACRADECFVVAATRIL